MSTVLSRPHPPFSPASRPQPPAASHAHPPKSDPPAAVYPAPIPAVTSPSPQLISLVRSLVGEQIKEWIETVHVGNIERSQRILQEQKETMNLIQNLSSYLQKIDQKLQNSNEMVGLLSKKTHNQANDILTLYQKIQELASATQQPPQQLQQPFEEPMISKKIHEILQSHSELKQQIVCQNEKIQEFQLTLSELARDLHDSQSSAEENLTKTSDYFQTLHTELYNDIHSQKERTEKSFKESNVKLEQLSAQLATATAISAAAAAAAPVPSTVVPMSLSEPHSVGEQQQEREQLQGQHEQRQEVFEKRVRAELEVLQREQRLLEREMALLRGEFQHSNNTMGITMGSPSSQRFQQQPQLLYSPPPLAFSSQPRNEHQQLQLQSPQGHGWQQGPGQQETSSELLSPRTPYPHNHRTYIPPSSAATAELSSSFPFPISGPAVSVSVTPRYSDPSMTLHEDPHEDDPPPPSAPGPSSMNPNLSNASLHSFDSTSALGSASAAGLGAGIRPGSGAGTGAGAGGDGSSNSGRSHRSKNLQRQKTLSDELIALLDIISEKERDVRSASEKKTMIKHFIKAKLTEFQQRYGRYPTMEEKEAMAEIYFQHQEAALLKEEAMLSLQDAKELLEEKRAELEQISFEEEEERGTGRLGEGERQEEAKL